MALSKNKVKTTFHLDRAVYSKFADNIKRLGLRRDLFLNRVLGSEIDELKAAEPNYAKAEKLMKWIRGVRRNDYVKVSISLDEKLIDLMNKACAKVRIPRDQFMEHFLEYLNEGASNGNCASPMAKAIMLIADPRFEYYGDPGERSAYDGITGMDDESVESAIASMRE